LIQQITVLETISIPIAQKFRMSTAKVNIFFEREKEKHKKLTTKEAF
jgi:hypothetical protein